MARKTPTPFAYSDQGFKKAVAVTISRQAGMREPVLTVLTTVANREKREVRWVDGPRETFCGWGETAWWSTERREFYFAGRLEYAPCCSSVSALCSPSRLQEIGAYGVGIEKRMRKMQDVEGRTGTVGQWVGWLARAIDAELVYIEDRTVDGEPTIWFADVPDGVRSVQQLIANFTERMTKKSAA